MGHSPACWGSWYSVPIAGEESMEPWLIKIHPRFTRQAKRGGEIGWWVFPVLFTISQGFLIRASWSCEQFTGLCQLISEKLVLTGRGQVASLEHFCTEVSQMLFPELRSSNLIHSFCHYLDLFTIWPLGLQGWPFFPYQTESDYGEWYCWPLEVRKKSKKPCCGCCCLIQGSRGWPYWPESRRHHQGSLFSIGPTIPEHLAPWEGSKRQQQTCMIFSFRLPVMPQCDRLRGAWSRLLWDSVLHRYHTQVLHCWVVFGWRLLLFCLIRVSSENRVNPHPNLPKPLLSSC